jgi:hypothetical protein
MVEVEIRFAKERISWSIKKLCKSRSEPLLKITKQAKRAFARKFDSSIFFLHKKKWHNQKKLLQRKI